MLKVMNGGLWLVLVLVGTVGAQSRDGLKVFISVDMEGVTGVVNVDDASRGGKGAGRWCGVRVGRLC